MGCANRAVGELALPGASGAERRAVFFFLWDGGSPTILVVVLLFQVMRPVSPNGEEFLDLGGAWTCCVLLHLPFSQCILLFRALSIEC